MTKVEVLASCGCGYSTRDLEKAKSHSETTFHKMTIFGSVTTPKPPKVVLTATTKTHVLTPVKVESVNMNQFQDLKALIGKR